MHKTPGEVWTNCLKIIRENVNEQSFKTWFEPITAVKIEDNVLTIEVPSQFFYEWLEEHYVPLLRKTIRQELGVNARLEYRIIVDNGAPGFSVDAPTNVQQPQNQPPEVEQQPEFAKTPVDPIKNPFVIPGIRRATVQSQLNPNYTFGNFVEGECNQLARSAGLAIGNKPGGTAFNPLVLYSSVGLGKTHLAQAVGNFVKENFNNKIVLYVTSEKFTNQFIEALKTGSISDFIHFYQMVDVLIVDDIQFFANKDKTQDIFFHTFNHLHQNGKQIILTSDRPPKDLEGMEERLLSRFKWGLITDLGVPAYETRVAILESKMSADGIELPREIVEFIAHNITTNIRELEGVLNSMKAQAKLSRNKLDLAVTRKIVKNFVNDFSRKISIDSIQRKVCDAQNLDVEELTGKSRKRKIVQARQIAMYLCKKFTDHSLKEIGKAFGGRDHSTVIHSCQTITNLMDTDRDIQDTVMSIQRQLQMGI